MDGLRPAARLPLSRHLGPWVRAGGVSLYTPYYGLRWELLGHRNHTFQCDWATAVSELRYLCRVKVFQRHVKSWAYLIRGFRSHVQSSL